MGDYISILGSCWVASFDVDAARAVLGIPRQVEPIIFMPLGYPAGSQGEKERKSLDELILYNSWDDDQN